ncbi:MAG: 2-succinyl-5-enolpyruvyl-6-hydroxy-3-cyclohexene-1-carboxylic-acid synthase [Candidatus Omnitrophica bacterium]|nr:2-succinyl-5-enolpyruvyl-6-hydroxy-3-cyclohexene-1-carboxylic-acid synthase [Candidatus Omnitrophota bacterium]
MSSRKIKSADLQQLWADLAVEELIRCGVEYFCVAPGSRSTPLTVAVAANPKARQLVHFDERGLGFYALGYAAARKGGVAVITTSGTAVANLLPAVIEASKKKLPLVVLSADRPPELRQTGANQTITQPGIFSGYVRWETDLPVACAETDPAFVLTTMDQAVYRSQGEIPGPVHINWMFREPFAAESQQGRLGSAVGPALYGWARTARPYTTCFSPETLPAAAAVEAVTGRILSAKTGVIVCGKLSGPAATRHVLRLAQKLQWPVFPDITSGLRLAPHGDLVIRHYQHLLPYLREGVDAVLHLGGRMTAKSYYEWLARYCPRDVIMVLNHPLRNDPQHQVEIRVQGCPGEFARKLAQAVRQRPAGQHLKRFQRKEAAIQNTIRQWGAGDSRISEPAVMQIVSNCLPKPHVLFVSNSLAVREMDAFADGRHEVPVGANRGASGIDGILASAAGFAKGLSRPVTVLVGDLAFLYDMNSLALWSRDVPPAVIVVLNNNGGGIFEFLPIAENNKDFERYFAAPHGMHFDDIARQFHVHYERPETTASFEKAYRAAVKAKSATLIEVVTDRRENFRLHQTIANRIRKSLGKQERG